MVRALALLLTLFASQVTAFVPSSMACDRAQMAARGCSCCEKHQQPANTCLTASCCTVRSGEAVPSAEASQIAALGISTAIPTTGSPFAALLALRPTLERAPPPLKRPPPAPLYLLNRQLLI